ncbi:MAG: nuclear transport factor 2 family protein [Propionivibrio sp.]
MPLDLPKPINDYFIADRGDGETVARCFTDHAVVKDEGHTYNGLAAIRQWKTDTFRKYTYTSEPFACEEKDGKTIVSSRLTGNFPGSPVDLRYVFGLEGGKIGFLEITL